MMDPKEALKAVILFLDQQMEQGPSRELADHINFLQDQLDQLS